MAEQKRLDFRPSDELPTPLDQPTDACSLISALLAAVLQEGSQTLHGANLVSFNVEVRGCALVPSGSQARCY